MLNLKLSQKLPMIIAGSALVVGIGMGLIGLNFGSSALLQANEEKLVAIASDRAHSLHNYFENIEGDLGLLARNPRTFDALMRFNAGFSIFSDTATQALHSAYITDNPNALGEKHLLDFAAGDSRYDNVHELYHPSFRDHLLNNDYYDIFLFNSKGDLVYSVFKELDFATNFSADGGEWADTDLGKSFRASIDAEAGVTAFFDYAPYAPSNGVPASFMSTPIVDANGETVGVLAFQMPIDKINSLMNDKTGLGKTGETVIVGTDFLMRNDSTFTEENDILRVSHDNGGVRQSLAGEESHGEWYGLDGELMDVAGEPFEFKGVHWAVLSTQEQSEIRSGLTNLKNWMLLVGGGLLALATIMALVFSRSITQPISRLTNEMKQLSDGDLETEIMGVSRTDEIGEMAKTVEIFKESAQKVAHMTEAEKVSAVKRNSDRAAMMGELGEAFGAVVGAAASGDFSKRVTAEFPDDELNQLGRQVNSLVETVERGLSETGDVLGALANTDLTQRVKGDYQGSFLELKKDTNAVADRLSEIVGQLRDTSGELKSATGEILAGANDLSERTTKQAANVEETSATMEELSGTVIESAQQADGASQRSANLAKTAEETGTVVNQATEAMERITSSSAKISNVIGMIDDIAFQTNLLALNASVEAARAGEAGKGFAVVAVEVRRLAQSAAEASTEVKQLIEQSAVEVKKGTGFVSSAAERLQNMIGGIKKNSKLMADLAGTSRDQASSIEEINAAVRQMDEMTQHNAALVEETNAAIEQTDSQVNALDRIIEVFKLSASAGGSAPAATPTSSVSNKVPPLPEVKQMQAQVQSAAKSYLSEGSAAVDSEWDEF